MGLRRTRAAGSLCVAGGCLALAALLAALGLPSGTQAQHFSMQTATMDPAGRQLGHHLAGGASAATRQRSLGAPAYLQPHMINYGHMFDTSSRSSSAARSLGAAPRSARASKQKRLKSSARSMGSSTGRKSRARAARLLSKARALANARSSRQRRAAPQAAAMRHPMGAAFDPARHWASQMRRPAAATGQWSMARSVPFGMDFLQQPQQQQQQQAQQQPKAGCTCPQTRAQTEDKETVDDGGESKAAGKAGATPTSTAIGSLLNNTALNAKQLQAPDNMNPVSGAGEPAATDDQDRELKLSGARVSSKPTAVGGVRLDPLHSTSTIVPWRPSNSVH
jgi:hypothetical protein